MSTEAAKPEGPAPAGSRFGERFHEFFTLRSAAAHAAKLPADDRTRGSEDFAVARQKREAAQALWIHGSTAEALRLAVDASDLILKAVEALSIDTDKEALEQLRSLQAVTVPRRNEAITAADARVFEQIIDTQGTVLHSLAPVAMTERDRLRTRVARIGWTAAFALSALFLLKYLLHPPLVLRAEASAAYSPGYQGPRAVDGQRSTEWCLPDRTVGHLDITVTPVRRVRRVRVLNIYNPPNHDRATKDYTIEVFSKGALAPSQVINATFPEFRVSPEFVTHDVSADKVERIRITVKSWHKDGGGLAEVEVE